jgi:hypothetical protein
VQEDHGSLLLFSLFLTLRDMIAQKQSEELLILALVSKWSLVRCITVPPSFEIESMILYNANYTHATKKTFRWSTRNR